MSKSRLLNRFLSVIALLITFKSGAYEFDNKLLYFPNEVLVNQILQKHEPKSVLDELVKVESRMLDSNSASAAYYLATRCYQENLDKVPEAQRTSHALFSMMIKNSDNDAQIYKAAHQLCLGLDAAYLNKLEEYYQHLQNAVGYIRDQVAPLLTYWIHKQCGIQSQRRNKHLEALESLKLALEIATANDDVDRIYTIRGSIVDSEVELGFFEEALKNSQSVIEWAESEKKNPNYLAKLYQAQGYILLIALRHEDAVDVLNKGLKNAEKAKNEFWINTILSNIAAAQIRLEKYDEAIATSERVLQYSNENKNDYLKAQSKALIATVYLLQDKVDLAQPLIEQSTKQFIETDQTNSLAQYYGSWSTALYDTGHYKKAYNALVKFNEYENEIFNTERDKSILELKNQYESVQKDGEIKRLSEMNKRKDLELKNQNLQQQIWWMGGLIAGLVIILLGFLYRRQRERNLLLFDENKRLDKQNHIDPLTKAYNRRFLTKKLLPRLKLLSGTDTRITFYSLDLDHFKLINDTYGHEAGDQVLIDFVQRIKISCRENDYLIRMGGEEFLLIISSSNSVSDSFFAKKLMQIITGSPIETTSVSIHISASIGAIHVGGSNHSPDEYLKVVDQALYEAKTDGRNRTVFYVTENQEKIDNYNKPLEASLFSKVTVTLD